jgi:hypothetical protein
VLAPVKKLIGKEMRFGCNTPDRVGRRMSVKKKFSKRNGEM